MAEKGRKIDYEAVALTEAIKSQNNVRIIMSDNEVLHCPVKWFTEKSLGTSDGKIISRRFIKIIETDGG